MPGTVLIVDDSETLREAIADTLRRHDVCGNCIVASNGLVGLKKLIDQQVDLVVCDLEMPDIDGYRFLALKNDRPELLDIPVVMLTGTANDVAAKVRCFEAGASDYVTKPYEAEELVARVKAHLKIKALQDELRRKNEQLERLSATDELTGLANRRHFLELFEIELRRATRLGSSTGVLMVDIDFFKSINDSHGHEAGDITLTRVAAIMKSSVRPYDVVARFGGEEFCVLLPQTTLADSSSVGERLRRAVEALTIQYEGATLSPTVSIGVTSGYGALDHAELIRTADRALYEAKSDGRNRVVTLETSD